VSTGLKQTTSYLPVVNQVVKKTISKQRKGPL